MLLCRQVEIAFREDASFTDGEQKLYNLNKNEQILFYSSFLWMLLLKLQMTINLFDNK